MKSKNHSPPKNNLFIGLLVQMSRDDDVKSKDFGTVYYLYDHSLMRSNSSKRNESIDFI
jgi:hypothetical protein